jgi:hypothetical protein
MDKSYKNACAAPSLESPPNLSATKIESLCDSDVIVPCLVGTPNKAQRNATLLSHISIIGLFLMGFSQTATDFLSIISVKSAAVFISLSK